MRYATIVLRTNGSIEMNFQDDWHLELDKIHELLGGGFFEVVNPNAFYGTEWMDVRMLVDDCGLLKELPKNELASRLYESLWDNIVGDAILCTTTPQELEEEPDIYAFTEDDAKSLLQVLI